MATKSPASSAEPLVPIHFGADPEYLIHGLSADISTMECVFDLVDNSIDAARSEVLLNACDVDEYGLPKSYAGYSIDLWLSPTAVVVKDDCSGMKEDELSTRAFRTGAKSRHPFGIGHFGVGLKRAIFKLGKSVSLATDNGSEEFDFVFSEADVLAAGDSPLFASRHLSGGSKGNRLSIENLRADVAADIGSSEWNTELARGLRRRYGIFTAKGLGIRLNDQPILSFGPSVRRAQVGPVSRSNQAMRTEAGVSIFAEAGLHEDYRIKGMESDYDEGRHRAMSSEQGWYVVCNDRIILVADRSDRTGWTTGWHNEYAGFLGWVYFVAEDPELLPWDSKKSGINPSNDAYRASVPWMKKIADEFRAQKSRLRDRNARSSAGGARPRSEFSSTAGRSKLEAPRRGGTKASVEIVVPPAEQFTHTETLPTLFHACEIKTTSPKVRSLADEACRLTITEFPYAAAFALRAFFEVVLIDYLKRIGRFGEVKLFYFEKQAAEGREFTESQKRNFSPSLDNILEWVLRTEDVFPDHDIRTCRRGCEDFKSHVKRLNGIVHEDGVLTGSAEVAKFRNDVLPTLRILLEHQA